MRTVFRSLARQFLDSSASKFLHDITIVVILILYLKTQQKSILQIHKKCSLTFTSSFRARCLYGWKKKLPLFG